ncbi:hypothetical protein M231_03100 [Tremella mesenterica]|uniref:DUF7587 domain-containing protein n=1 Tax=Tremella mesenterica TaxID=5217 RepID=A0A4Q1BP03_TREME|nr:uncharacterized protein TREMEDRAFT_63013 [Tremella mesenterica DSM 1558]EIW68547.1 hypothetical protein TREMEDRAFT_63013 [Tremella mesenterica DSM 1558]RXK39598.1 hypothetical protein M231_03100 [Tremella mesenterica]
MSPITSHSIDDLNGAICLPDLLKRLYSFFGIDMGDSCKTDLGHLVRILEEKAQKEGVLFRVYDDEVQSPYIKDVGTKATDMASAKSIWDQIRSLDIPTEGRIIDGKAASRLTTLFEGTRHPTYHCTKGWTNHNMHEKPGDPALASPFISCLSSFGDALHYALGQMMRGKKGMKIAVIVNTSLAVFDPSDIILHPGDGVKSLPIYLSARWSSASFFSSRHREYLVLASIPATNFVGFIPLNFNGLGVCLPPEFYKADVDPTKKYWQNLLWDPCLPGCHKMHIVRDRIRRRKAELAREKAKDLSKRISDDASNTSSDNEHTTPSTSTKVDSVEDDLALALKKLSV